MPADDGVSICPVPWEAFLYAEPHAGNMGIAGDLSRVEVKIAGKQFSRLGLSFVVFMLAASLAQVLFLELLLVWMPALAEQTWFTWLAAFAPMYLVGVPVCLLVAHSVPAVPLEKGRFRSGQLVSVCLVSVFMMYAGNLIGTLVSAFLPQSTVAVDAFLMADTLWLKILFLVVLAPVLEELIFRKMLIDRIHIYGQKTAIFTSAVIFALFHGNTSQLFYAFGLGLILGYLYLRSGKLRYSIGLHMGVNFFGGIVGPLLLERVSNLVYPQEGQPDVTILQSADLWILLGYSLTILLLAVVGLVVLCVKKRKAEFRRAEKQLPRRAWFRTVYLNWGMGLYVLLTVGFIVIQYIP